MPGGSTDWDDDNTDVREQRRSDRLRRLELRDAEMFGVEGGGRFGNLEADVRAQKIEISRAHMRIDGTELFQHRIRWTVGIAVSASTLVAMLLLKVFEYFTK